ncbi:MAG: ABC transporter permease, partial [Micrococcaceae bacterium]|nr:ABC transporter permease [Micrococcaceae bacterium]
MPTPDTVERPATGPDPTEPAGPEAGPDRLPMPAPATRRDLRAVLLPAAALLVLICLWQILSWSGLKRPDLFPGPGAVAAGMGDALLDGTLQNAVATSLGRGVTGFAISVAIATPLALLLAQSATLRAALGPLVSGLQVLPSVAWVPAAIIWFGLPDATVYFVVLMGATPSIVNGLLSGIDQIPPHYGSVGTVLGATRRQQTLLITLPAALPAYLGGLKQGWAFSWRSLMAAEIIAVGGSIGFGLGSMLQQGRDLSSMALVMAALLV